MDLKRSVLLPILGLLCCFASCLQQEASAQTITRLTFNQGTDIYPAWDPQGITIAYVRSKIPGGQVYDAYKVESSGQAGEEVLLSGLNTDFGVAIGLSWIGSGGFLAVEEAISGFEVLRFDTARAPFDRTTTNGTDSANTLLLSINGGGGGGITKFSRDGTTALIRFSTSGSSGAITIRSGLVSNMTGGLSSSFGTVLLSTTSGDSLFLNGGAISPDGSSYVLATPISSSTSGHNLVLGSTTGAFSDLTLTTDAATGVLNVFPDFSPDGTKIAFARRATVNEAFDLWMVNTDGTGLTQLTNTPNFSENNPSWSPDGGSIAFNGIHLTGQESASPALEAGESANQNIYILTLPAANIVTPKTRLTDPPIVTIDGRTVTFTFVQFLKAQFGPVVKAAWAEIKAGKKVSFKYDLSVFKTDGKKKEVLRKLSKRNTVTKRNLAPGNYTAKYRVQITSKQPSKPPVVKYTRFSPVAGFTIRADDVP